MTASVVHVNSTTVRSNLSPGLKATRAAFSTLNRVSPNAAAAWALRMWCTLPTSRGLRRDLRPYIGWLDTVHLPDGRRVVSESWGEGPTIYLLHGWGGWRGQLGSFVTPLVRAGFEVVAFDVPSHGESGVGNLGKRRSTAMEFAETLTAVARRYGTPAGVVAHSFGAPMSVLAIRDGLHIGRLAFIAPVGRPIKQTETMQRMLGYDDRAHQRFLEHLQRLADRPLPEFDIDAPLPTVAAPALIVHDTDDKEVPVTEGEWLANYWPEADLVTTNGLGHQRILGDPGVVNRVADFLASR